MTSERDRSALLLLTGAFAVWLSVSGVLLNFVKPSMRPYVLAAGVLTILLALLPPGGLLARRPAVADDHGHGHDHGRSPVVWLLVVPLLVVILVPPSPLGANAIRARVASAKAGSGTYRPVGPPVRGAVPMSMAEYTTRALRDTDRSLEGVTVRLTGFVSRPEPGGGYRLARFVIFCCAADGEAVEVVVTGDAKEHPVDQWLEVEGTWEPGEPARLRATSARPIGQPEKPYEYTDVWTG